VDAVARHHGASRTRPGRCAAESPRQNVSGPPMLPSIVAPTEPQAVGRRLIAAGFEPEAGYWRLFVSPTMRRWIDELSFPTRVMLIAVVILVTAAVILWRAP
jgi:hypothetical protein